MIVAYERCYKHDVIRLAGVECYQCAVENAQADRVEAIVETLHIHSHRMDRTFDVLMVLEARIADLEEDQIALWKRQNDQAAQIEQLHQQMTALQQRLDEAEAQINPGAWW